MADYEGCGTVPVHVIDAVLRVILDNENRHFRPES